MNNSITYTDLKKKQVLSACPRMKQIQVVYSNPQMEEMRYLYCHLPWSCRYKCLMCLAVWRAEHVSLSTCSHIFASVSLFSQVFITFYHFSSLFITFFIIFYHFCVYHLVFKILSKLIPTILEAKIGFLMICSRHKFYTSCGTASESTRAQLVPAQLVPLEHEVT